MATADQIIAKAESYTGYTEGPGNRNQFSTMMDRPPEPWCADYVCAIFKMCGALDLITNSASCGVMIAGAKKNGTWHAGSDGIRRGDLPMFDWDRDRSQDHVGICTGVKSPTEIYTIEGNTSKGPGGSQSNGDGVYKRTRAKSLILGYIRPKYDGTTTSPGETSGTTTTGGKTCMVELPMLQQGSSGKAVRALQTLLKDKFHYSLDVDGDFGPITTKKVKAFQKARGIGQDGVVGPKTWDRLINS